MLKHFLIFLTLFCFLRSERQEWSSTPIDNFFNSNFNQMIFREPIYLIPYELKIGLFNYGGNGYFANVLKGNFELVDNPVLLDNQDINNNFISSVSSRNGFFIELDIFKYNFLEKFFHQNLYDFHIGTGLRYSSMLSNPIAPIYPNNSSYRFKPSIYETFTNLSLSMQYSPKFLIFGQYSFGLSYASLYQSLSQENYINASGLNENFSFGYKYILKKDALPYDYLVGLEIRFGRTYLNKIYDKKDETPINGMNMHNFGIFLTFGTMFGGNSSKADKAYSLMLKKDYISASNKFKQFLNIYNFEFRHDEAKEMLNFCYTQIPYQYFDRGVKAFNANNYNEALRNFDKSEQIARPELILEIESYKRDIAKDIIDNTNQNIKNISFNSALNNLNKARKISSSFWAETDKVEAKILIEKGNILKALDDYINAINYYQEALDLDPTLFKKINTKYTELVIAIINDVNDTKNVDDLKLVNEYLKIIIGLKPKYKELFNTYIFQIEEKISLYDKTMTQINLKEYIRKRRSQSIISMDKKVNFGMSIHELEMILGPPTSISKENNFELWFYQNNNLKNTYFFKDFLLIKID